MNTFIIKLCLITVHGHNIYVRCGGTARLAIFLFLFEDVPTHSFPQAHSRLIKTFLGDTFMSFPSPHRIYFFTRCQAGLLLTFFSLSSAPRLPWHLFTSRLHGEQCFHYREHMKEVLPVTLARCFCKVRYMMQVVEIGSFWSRGLPAGEGCPGKREPLLRRWQLWLMNVW